jgi:hypothetical protein
MTRTVQFQTLPPFGGDQRQVADVVRGIMDGKTNNTGDFTLATGGATSTTINDARIGTSSIILFSPTSANQKDLYVSSKTRGSAVISHAANSTSGITYDYIVVG